MMIHTLALQEMTGFYYFPPNIFQINIFGPIGHSEVPLTLKHKWNSEAFLIGEQVKKKSFIPVEHL